MKKLVLVLLILLSGCASAPKRHLSDHVMTVIVDPSGLTAPEYNEVVSALSESKEWKVLDRAAGFEALKAEQARLHRGESVRFEDREKLALWGKMHGAGGVIVATEACMESRSFLTGGTIKKCKQQLSIINTTTSEVVSAVSNNVDSSDYDLPIAWTETVEKFNRAYPGSERQKDNLDEYRKLAEANAKAQKNAPKEKTENE